MAQEVQKINNILILKCDHDGQGIMRTPSHRGDKENIPGFVSDDIRGQKKEPRGCGSHKLGEGHLKARGSVMSMNARSAYEVQ